MTDSRAREGNEGHSNYFKSPPSSAISRDDRLPMLMNGVEVSSRVSLSRNIASYPFLDACSEQQRTAICQDLLKFNSATTNQDQFQIVDCRKMQLAEQQFLFELQAMVGLPLMVDWGGLSGQSPQPSRTGKLDAELRSENSPTAERVSIVSHPSSPSSDQQVSWVMNLEDHLRIDVQSTGNELARNWQLASAMDDELQRNLDFAFHPKFGFLTACPADAGTALRTRVLLHLPAVIAMGRHTELSNQLIRWNVALREAFGDSGGGDFFTVSNLSTLGLSESDVIDQVQKAVVVAVDCEHRAREKWRRDEPAGLKREIQLAMADLLTLEISSQNDLVRLKLIRALSRMRLGLQLQLLTAAEGAMVAAKFQLIWLKQRLEVAIANEDYRAASQLRDRINALGESR